MEAKEEMSTVKLEIPETLYNIYHSERDTFLVQGLRHYTKYRVKELEKEIEYAESQLESLKKKYGTDFEDFEARIVTKSEELEVHEDYNEWFYWREVLTRHKETISRYRKFQGLE